MSHSGWLRAIAPLLAVGTLAACSSTPTGGGAAEKSSEPARPSAATDPSHARRPPVLTCQEPDTSVIAKAATAIAPHAGPVRAAILVRAARTDTGTWYVVGIDRDYVFDDGTPTGQTSRSLALTNAPAGVNFIPLGEGETDRPFETSWDRVSWTGNRLATGQRALREALGCLDATRGKS